MKQAINIKAIFWGFVTDNVTTLAVGAITGLTLAIFRPMRNVSPERMKALTENPSILLLAIIVSSIGTIIGGLVAGRIAKDSPILHGGIVGSLCLILAPLLWSSHPLWYNMVGVIATIPLGILGGYIAKKNSKQTAVQDPEN